MSPVTRFYEMLLLYLSCRENLCKVISVPMSFEMNFSTSPPLSFFCLQKPLASLSARISLMLFKTRIHVSVIFHTLFRKFYNSMQKIKGLCIRNLSTGDLKQLQPFTWQRTTGMHLFQTLTGILNEYYMYVFLIVDYYNKYL